MHAVCCRIQQIGRPAITEQSQLNSLQDPYQRHESIKLNDGPLEQVRTIGVASAKE